MYRKPGQGKVAFVAGLIIMVVSGCSTASGTEFGVGDCIRESVNAEGQAEPVDCTADDSLRIQKLAKNGGQPTCEYGYYLSPKGFSNSKETMYVTDAVTDITYCGGPGWASGTAQKSQPPGSDATAQASAPPTDAPGITGSVPLKTDEGYTFTASFNFTAGTPRKDVEEAPPGEADLLLPVSGTVTIANTTDGRELPRLREELYGIIGLWPAKSAACKDADGRVDSGKLTRPEGKYCLRQVATAGIPQQSIPVGASSSAELAPPFGNNGASTEWRTRIAEDDYAAASSAFAVGPPLGYS